MIKPHIYLQSHVRIPETDAVIRELFLQHLDDKLSLVQLSSDPPVLGSAEVRPTVARLDGRVPRPVLTLPLCCEGLRDGAAPDHQIVRGAGAQRVAEGREAAVLLGGRVVLRPGTFGLGLHSLANIANIEVLAQQQEQRAHRACGARVEMAVR